MLELQPDFMPREPGVPKSPAGQYGLLTLLLVTALAYQTRVTAYQYPHWFGHPDKAASPFYVSTDASGIVIKLLAHEALAAGARDGDELLAVQGRRVAGIAVFGEALAAARPGDVLQLALRSREGDGLQPERAVQLTLRAHGQGDLLGLIFFVIMPFFCLLLGFWVAAVRPRDPLAWLLLALMLSFTAFPHPGVETWGPIWRDLGQIYRTGFNITWALGMMLFGIYFPAPFAPDLRPRWWDWCKWVIGVPLAVLAVPSMIEGVGELENLASVMPLERLDTYSNALVSLLSYAGVGVFFASLGTKMGLAGSKDAKRRLRLLFWGANVSLSPIFVLTIIAHYKHVIIEAAVPKWVSAPASLLLFLFPVTLAYVIVVHRAMDVRVVIRQGLQYAVAKSGIRLLRLAVGFALGAAVLGALKGVDRGGLTFYAIIAVGVAVWFGLRHGLEWLHAWTDRRFFRDAYQAEQILSELSDSVRSIGETTSLLVTVAERIAESLHVARIAVLIDGSGPYRPAYALGYPEVPDVTFPPNAVTVRQLGREGNPLRVYFDNPNSWVNRSPELTPEERAQLELLESELLLPLTLKDKLLGFVSLSQKRSEEPYSGGDLRLLKSVAAQTGLALENSRLTATIAEGMARREKLNRELEIAREVQERLFPQRLPPVPGLDYFGKCRPALGVGGDYYDFLALPGGKLGIAIGDVSGKGIAAALMMASLEASLRAEAMRGTDDLCTLIQSVNHLVFDATAENRYATFFYAQYDPSPRRLTYVNAGHNAPMLFRRSGGGGGPLRLEATGTVVGLLPDPPFQQAGLTLQPGDVLVAYTDGVTEAMNSADEEWGEDGMIATMGRADGVCAAETVERIIGAADSFAAGAQQHDDMTLVVLRVLTS
jgi:sigma-B regulation protein RsbU (phosphoserine phosphatase)